MSFECYKEYHEIRDCMKPGDVIAFSRNHLVSKTIELVTDSEIAHVGVVLPSTLAVDEGPNKSLNFVVEATASGVRIISLCGMQKNYDGEMWWLPLNCESRKTLEQDLNSFCEFLFDRDGTGYDVENAILEGLRTLMGEDSLFVELVGQISDSLHDRILSKITGSVKRDQLEEITDEESFKERIVKTAIDRLIAGNKVQESAKAESDQGKRYFCSELVAEAFQNHGLISNRDVQTVTPIELCQFDIYAKCVQFKGTEKKIFNSES